MTSKPKEEDVAEAEIVADEELEQSRQLVPYDDAVPAMIYGPDVALAKLSELQDFVRKVMVAGEDYGFIPLTGECTLTECKCGKCRRSLLQPGAQKLLEIYGYYAVPKIVQRIEDWRPDLDPVTGNPRPPFFHYEFQVEVHSKRTGALLGIGVGSCNSMEDKYRYRKGARVCPICEKENIRRSKNPDKVTGDTGWYCWAKTGGCGAQFNSADEAITKQTEGRVESFDTPSQVNTILKIAKKRAYNDVTLQVTRSAGLFTTDMVEEDGSVVEGVVVGAPAKAKTGPVTQPSEANHRPVPPASYSDQVTGKMATVAQLERLKRQTERMAIPFDKSGGKLTVWFPDEVFKVWKAPIPGTLDERATVVWSARPEEVDISGELLEKAIEALQQVPVTEELPF